MARRSDDGVAWLRATRSRIVSGERFSSSIDALAPLLAACDLLEVLPPPLLEAFPHASWGKMAGCERTESAHLYVLNSGWLVDAQRFLLERVVVDWVEDLSESIRTLDGTRSTVRDEVLLALFRPQYAVAAQTASKPRSGLIAIIDDEEDKVDSKGSGPDAKLAATGHILASGLAAIGQVLSHAAKNRSGGLHGLSSQTGALELTQDAALFVLKLLVAKQDSGPSPLQALLAAATQTTNLAQRDKFWQDAVKELCAVPARVSNMLGAAEMPIEVQDGPFFAALAKQTEAAVFHLASTSDDGSECKIQLSLLSKLLEKLVRSGVPSRALELATTSSRSNQADFLRTLVQGASTRLEKASTGNSWTWPPHYSAMWQRVIRGMEPSDLSTRLAQNIVAYLDSVSFVAQKRGDLVADGEKGRIGSEGQAFLSPSTAQASLLVATLLQLYLPLPLRQQHAASTMSAATSSRFSEVIEDGTDLDDANADDWKRWDGVVFSDANGSSAGLSCFSPAMARCLAVHIGCVGLSSQEASLATAVDHTMTRWGSSERLRRTSPAEVHYFTTLLLSLLAQCSRNSGVAAQLLQSPAFIQGVSAHMGHQDPSIRRMGMIVAEVLDAAVKQSAQSSISTSKRLDFGQSIWSGRGEGKEACRVLRAMVLGWNVSSPALQELPGTSTQGILLFGSPPPIGGAFGNSKNGKEVLPATVSSLSAPRPEATTRFIPERRPVESLGGPSQGLSLIQDISTLSIMDGGKARRSRPLIAVTSEPSTTSGADTKVGRPLRAYNLPNEADEDVSSSSESDSEDDDEKEELMPSSSGKHDEDGPELLDVTVLKKRQRRRPVYIGELIPLLRSTERRESRKGLKNSEELIRRKTGWGLEVEENAVELALALAALQNNWSTKHFEERRTGALTALIVAAPQSAGGCIIEQYFSGHYSIAQRMAMLNSLVEAARELAERGGQKTPLTAKQTAAKNADALINLAAGGARQYGEQKYPEVRQANSLNVLRGPRGTLIRETGPVEKRNGRPVNVPSLPGARTASIARYVDVASSTFIFPLLNRFWAVINDAGARHSRSLQASRGASRRPAASVWQGAGVGSVLSASAVGVLLDALAVLASLARNALDFQRVIVPELLELSIATPRAMLPLIGQDEDSDGMGRIHEGAITLAVILVDAAREADQGRFLRREKGLLLRELDAYAGEVFKLEHEKERGPSSAMGRAGRASATLLLRLQEIQSS
ncbi:telomere binding protein [Tilletia horrida]|nr:telomere binding protein [Tilletia horrida]